MGTLNNGPALASVDLSSLDDTSRLGALLAELLPTGSCVGLNGTLGAGKTTLVQSLLAATGFNPHQVTSPTFSLIQTYRAGARTIHHIDAYRIADEDEFFETGAYELLEDPLTITLIEWADKMRHCLPADTLWMDLEASADQARRVEIRGDSSRWGSIVDEIVQRFRTKATKADDGRDSAAPGD